MGSFKLEIELGNDAMRSPFHIARVLEAIAKRLDRKDDHDHESRAINDNNGNRVGVWTYENDDEEDE